MSLVKPHGPKKGCKIAIVGDYGRKDELLHGIPFVGGHGKLLNEMCAKAGINRTLFERYVEGHGYRVEVFSEAYTTLLWKDKIPESTFEKSIYKNQSKKLPNELLLAKFEELRQELSDCEANVIVAAGDATLQALTGKTSINNWRGSILESTLLPGRKIIPIVHPANILVQWYYRVLTIQDLKRVRSESNFAEVMLPQRTYIIEPSFYEAVECLEALLREAEYLSFDIETKGTHISCIGFSHDPLFAICIPFMRHIHPYWEYEWQETAIWTLVARLLDSPIKKIAQNAQFDMSYMAAHGCPVRNIWWDTMLAQSILYPELEKSLAVLASIYTKEPYYKDEGKAVLGKKNEKAWQPGQKDQKLWLYNCRDAAVTCEVAFEQQKDMMDLSISRRFG